MGKCLRQRNSPFKGPEAGLCLGVGGTVRRSVWLELSEQGGEREELRAGKGWRGPARPFRELGFYLEGNGGPAGF